MSELQQLKNRNGRPYSEGHRAMYKTVAGLLSNEPANILELGCGIGDGIEILLTGKCVNELLAIEKTKEDFWHTKERFSGCRNVSVINYDWLSFDGPAFDSCFDFCTCIEVIEHVEKKHVDRFLARIYQSVSNALFLSTPNVTNHSHGTRTPDAWCEALERAGFRVSYVEWQWTTFFMANKQ